MVNLALRSDGTVAAWGDNSSGQTTVPAGLSNVVAMAGGNYHSLALRSDGTVAAWGDNSYSVTTVPAGLSNVVAVAGGNYYSLAAIVNTPPAALGQTVYALRGVDRVISLAGTDTEGDRLTFRVTSLPATGILYQYNGGGRGAAVSSSGTTVTDPGGRIIYAPPATGTGPLKVSFQFVANDDRFDSAAATVLLYVDNPPQVFTQPATPVTVSNALLHGMVNPCGVATTAWFDWGASTNLANVTGVTNVGVGERVVWVGLPVTGLVAGQGYFCRLVASNSAGVVRGGTQVFGLGRTVLAWGNNSSDSVTNVPAGLNDVVAVAGGDYHSLALRSDGTVAAWGRNWEGQTNVPAGLSSVVAVAGGGSHSLALRSDGTVAAWGYNSYGVTTVPAGWSNVLAVAGGDEHSLALIGNCAPVLVTPAANRTVAVGANASFSVTVVGTPPFSYQWLFNGVDLAGATNATFTRTNTQMGDAGNYTVVVTNLFGSVTSAPPAMLTVLLPVVISIPPASQPVLLGGNVNLSVSVSGSAPLSYQWQLNGGSLPGATNVTLALTNVQWAQAGSYVVVVSNPVSSATSTPPAVLRVVLIGDQPQSITFSDIPNCLVGSPAFTLQATASSGLPVAFTQVSGPPSLVGNVVTPAAAGMITIRASQPGSAIYAPAAFVTNTFSVVGTNFQRVLQITLNGSPIAVVGVAYGNGRFVAVGPATGYTSACASQKVIVLTSTDGLNWTLQATTGLDCGAVVRPERFLFAGNEFIMVGRNNSGTYPTYYSSISRSPDGVAWSSQMVGSGTVTLPCGYYASSSSTTCLTDMAYGNDIMLIQGWASSNCGAYHIRKGGLMRYFMATGGLSLNLRCEGDCWDGRSYRGVGYGNGKFIFIFAGHCYSTLDGSNPTDCGVFPVLETDDYGAAAVVRFAYGTGHFVAAGLRDGTTTNGAILTSTSGTVWPTTPNYTSAMLRDVAFLNGKFMAVGDSGTILQSVDDGITWSRVTNSWKAVDYSTTSNLCAVAYNDNRYVVVGDGVILVSYQPPVPVLTGQPQSQIVAVGSNAVFTVSATGGLPLSYQWQHNGANLPGAVTPSLNLTSVQLLQAGDYRVVVTNSAGAVTSQVATLTVYVAPPVVITPPQSRLVGIEHMVTFSADLGGSPPLQYQWLCNGTDLPGETHAALVLSNVQTNQAGAYTLVVWNSAGAVTSSPPAVLTVATVWIDLVSLSANRLAQLRLYGETGTAYEIQVSTNLVTWTAVGATTLLPGTNWFTNAAPAAKTVFYRMRLLTPGGTTYHHSAGQPDQ